MSSETQIMVEVRDLGGKGPYDKESSSERHVYFKSKGSMMEGMYLTIGTLDSKTKTNKQITLSFEEVGVLRRVLSILE